MTRSPRGRGRKSLRVLLRLALGSLLAASAVLLASLWIVPWLGRRGSLNSLIEGIVRSALQVPIEIESVVSEPLSKLTVTHLRSLRAQAEDRFQFEASSISVFYDPIELLSGKVRTVIFESPSVFLDLDAPLAGVARLPELPPEMEAPRSESPLLLPFTIDTAIITQGTLRLRFEARELPLSGLELRVLNLGKPSGQKFTLDVAALGGRVRASGGLSVLREAGRPATYRLEDVTVSIEDFPLSFFDPALTGAISLQGSLRGTWPEKVELHLESAARALGAEAGGMPAVRDANVALRLNAVAHGDLERIALDLRTEGSGEVTSGQGHGDERASLAIRGELRRGSDEPGGVLELEPSSLVLEGIGLVKLEGRIRAPLDPPRSELRISADIPDLRPGEALARLPRGLLPPAIESLPMGRESSLDVHLEIEGSLVAPRASGSFDMRQDSPGGEEAGAALEILGSFLRAEIDLDHETVHVPRLELRSRGVAAALVARAAGIDALARGTLDAEVDARDLRWPPGDTEPAAAVRVVWKEGGIESPAGFVGVSGVDLELAGEARLLPRELELRATAGLRVAEALIDTFYVEPRKPFVIDASGSFLWNEDHELEGVEIAELSAVFPGLGPIAARGSLFDGASGGLEVDGRIELSAIPLEDAYRILIREWLGASVPFLAGGQLAGKAAAEIVARGPAAAPGSPLPPFSARLGLEPGEARMPGLNVDRLELECPIQVGSSPPPLPGGTRDAVLRADRIESGPAMALGMRMPFRLREDGRYELTSRARFRALEGVIEIREASVVPAGEKAEASLSLRADGLALAPLALSRGLPPLQGSMGFDFDPIVLARGRGLEARGTLRIEAFGGTFTFQDLRIRNLSEPYSSLHLGRGTIEGVRLAEIGKVFGFGILSGVLRGEVRNLSFTGGEVSSFEIDVETVPTSGVPQYVDKRAIASIRRILSGPIGVIEEGLFSKFRYHRLGFWCSLQDGVFRLQGKYTIGGVEYLMHGRWYQFPRVDIVNARPGKPYDWRSIVERIRGIGGE